MDFRFAALLSSNNRTETMKMPSNKQVKNHIEIQKLVRRMMRAQLQSALERKISIPSTVPQTPTVQNWSGTVYPIAGIAQGTALNQRVGNKITLRALKFMELWQGNAASVLPATGRTIIFVDTASPGAPPSASEVLDISLLGTAGAPLAQYTASNVAQGRFRILYDKLTSISNGGAMNQALPQGSIPKRTLKLKTQVFFSGSGATTYLKNQIYLLAVCDVNVNDPTLIFSAELIFTDD